MNWQCRLYGHRFRHPGSFEVVIADGTAPTHPIECGVCGHEALLDAADGVRLDRRTEPGTASEPELERPVDDAPGEH